MKHYHRTSLAPDTVLEIADARFNKLGLTRNAADSRTRQFSGALGSLSMRVFMEGGHYTFVEVQTDQVGESRLDKNVKKFFVALHRTEEPRHTIRASC